MQWYPAFHVGSGDPHLGPHACTLYQASHLPTPPHSPTPTQDSMSWWPGAPRSGPPQCWNAKVWITVCGFHMVAGASAQILTLSTAPSISWAFLTCGNWVNPPPAYPVSCSFTQHSFPGLPAFCPHIFPLIPVVSCWSRRILWAPPLRHTCFLGKRDNCSGWGAVFQHLRQLTSRLPPGA